MTSQQTNHPGLGHEECKRQYANAAVFEATNTDHWNEVGAWYKDLFPSGKDMAKRFLSLQEHAGIAVHHSDWFQVLNQGYTGIVVNTLDFHF